MKRSWFAEEQFIGMTRDGGGADPSCRLRTSAGKGRGPEGLKMTVMPRIYAALQCVAGLKGARNDPSHPQDLFRYCRLPPDVPSLPPPYPAAQSLATRRRFALKNFDNRAVPHMRQSQFCTPKHTWVRWPPPKKVSRKLSRSFVARHERLDLTAWPAIGDTLRGVGGTRQKDRRRILLRSRLAAKPLLHHVARQHGASYFSMWSLGCIPVLQTCNASQRREVPRAGGCIQRQAS